MDARGAKRLFLLGTVLSSALFLWLTVDTHRQVPALTNSDRLTSQVVAGKQVWHKYNCNDCHTILGFGGYYAPDLTRAYWRLGDERLRNIIRDPDVVFAGSFRHMPKQNIGEDELTNLIAFLEWTSEINNNNWPPQDEKFRPKQSAAGRASAGSEDDPVALYSSAGCGACHRFAGKGSGSGPDLTHIGSKLSHDEILKVLTDPRSVNPEALMPTPNLTDEQRNALADLLAQAR